MLFTFVGHFRVKTLLFPRVPHVRVKVTLTLTLILTHVYSTRTDCFVKLEELPVCVGNVLTIGFGLI